jgi:hypothetical protein
MAVQFPLAQFASKDVWLSRSGAFGMLSAPGIGAGGRFSPVEALRHE